MKQTPITLAGLRVAPGEKRSGVLVLPGFFADRQSMEIPFLVIHGLHPGKRLYVQVAQHGNEVMGLEAVRGMVDDLDASQLHGTFIYCLPNPLSFRERNRATCFDPRPGGMNRIWPGNAEGSLTERMAHRVWEDLVCHADEVIDLHTSTRHCPVWLFYEAAGISPLADEATVRRSERMAHLFGAPVLYVQTEAYGDRKTLRARCVDRGIPAIVPELGGAGYFDQEIAGLGCRGIRNIMIDLGMIEGRVQLPAKQVKLKWQLDHTRFTVAAKQGGVFVPEVRLGDLVQKGSSVGFLYNPRDFSQTERLLAPADGYVFSIREDPVAHAGDVLMAIPEVLGWVDHSPGAEA